MENKNQQATGEAHWLTATELGVPLKFAAICSRPPAKINAAYAALESTCGQRLSAFYGRLGPTEPRALRTRLYFSAAVLLEQTAPAHKRNIVAKLRQWHLANRALPSVATVYRTTAALKAWLGGECNLDHAPTVKELKSDKRPLLLLSDENLADECKTVGQFLKTYRPSDISEETEPPLANLTTLAGSGAETKPGTAAEPVAAPFYLITGHLTPAMRKQIAGQISTGGGKLVALDGPAAEAARQWLDHPTPRQSGGPHIPAHTDSPKISHDEK